jgi:hypothetical protein
MEEVYFPNGAFINLISIVENVKYLIIIGIGNECNEIRLSERSSL